MNLEDDKFRAGIGRGVLDASDSLTSEGAGGGGNAVSGVEVGAGAGNEVGGNGALEVVGES